MIIITSHKTKPYLTKTEEAHRIKNTQITLKPYNILEITEQIKRCVLKIIPHKHHLQDNQRKSQKNK